MSVEVFRAGMRLRSRQLGRAVMSSERLRTVVHPEAIGIVALAMAGERTGLWGVGWGKVRRSQPTSITAVGDARDYKEQVRLWREMAKVFSTAGDEPQIVVSNRRTARLLAESAYRFRYDKTNTEIVRAAEIVWWSIMRQEIAGSHAAVILTKVLGDHFTIGADDGQEDDLRIWLAWIGATDPANLETRLARRLAEPPDPKTELEFDEMLWPHVNRRTIEKEERQLLLQSTGVGQIPSERDFSLQANLRSAVITPELKKILKPAWTRLTEAVTVLAKDPRAPLTDLGKFCGADRQSWAREEARRERGFGMSRHDSPRAAIMGLAEAEVAQELWEGALVWDDRVARAEAIAAGEAITGIITDCTKAGFTLAASMEGARARVGDSLAVMDFDAPALVEVVDVTDDGGAIGVSVEWKGGQAPLSAITLVVGDETVLWPPPPDFGRQFMGWLAGRIKNKHWAFDGQDEGSMSRDPVTAADPLAAVEALRKLP